MKKVNRHPAPPEVQDMLLDELVSFDDCNRMVLSFDEVICVPSKIFENGRLYAKADFKLPWLRNVFADCPMEFFVGLRNPATFVPAAIKACGSTPTYEEFLNGYDIGRLRWSRFVERIRRSCPDVKLTCFAFEDTPITWGKILREMTGADASVRLTGELEILNTVMTRDGLRALRTRLHENPPETEGDKYRLFEEFLLEHHDEDANEEEIVLPGWNAALVERLTDAYEDDLERIQQMDGVEFILP
ncbi:hypothetical protein [Celeribacter litoreus]|uniref:hypothetical protein n=1 Tax=Celeribacter litoreus TaxID=2876714 RepID=UPI001CCC6A12|nr:hypothetical protein [Celeribacter litoreus]